MGPWSAWWYPYLARNYTSVWSRLILELLTGPVSCTKTMHFWLWNTLLELFQRFWDFSKNLYKAPFLHVGFLSCYSHLHFSSLPCRNEFFYLLVQLLTVDLLIYSPIALINFKFIPPGLYQTIFVNAAYVLVVEPIGSLIINNGVTVYQLFDRLKSLSLQKSNKTWWSCTIKSLLSILNTNL